MMGEGRQKSGGRCAAARHACWMRTICAYNQPFMPSTHSNSRVALLSARITQRPSCSRTTCLLYAHYMRIQPAFHAIHTLGQSFHTLKCAHRGEQRAHRRISTDEGFLKQRMQKRRLHTLFLGRRTLNTMIVANYHHSYINDRCRRHQTSTHRHAEHQRNLGGYCNRRQRPLARSLVDELVQIIVGHGE